MPRPPVKKTRVVSEADAYGWILGKLKAEEHWFKQTAKGRMRGIERHIGKFIDAMAAKIDPLELGAVLGVTFMVHEALRGVKELMDKLLQLPAVQSSALGFLANPIGYIENLFSQPLIAPGPLLQQITQPQQPVNPLTGQPLSGKGGAISEEEYQAQKAAQAAQDRALQDAEIRLWITSFIVAFVIIRYGPAIVSSFGGISKMASTLIGLV